jgi:hypothetical protein
MAYVRLDDQIGEHVKVLRAGPAAAWMWAMGIAYSNRRLTDGFIPAEQIDRLTSERGAAAAKMAARCVDAGLFVPVDGGYQVHDYLTWNPSRDKVEQDKAAAAKRKAKWRHTVPPVSRGDIGGVTAGQPQPLAGARATPTPTPTPTPSSNDDDTGVSLNQARIASVELLALWQQHGTGAPTPQFGKLSFKEKCDLRDALKCRSLDECEALFKRAKASDYLSGRDGTFPPMSLWRVLAAAGAIESGEHDNRPRLTKGHRPFGVGAAVPSSTVAVVDPDYHGAEYRFHCGHKPTCTAWPQHRDMLNGEAVSA